MNKSHLSDWDSIENSPKLHHKNSSQQFDEDKDAEGQGKKYNTINPDDKI